MINMAFDLVRRDAEKREMERLHYEVEQYRQKHPDVFERNDLEEIKDRCDKNISRIDES